ncbi:MAG: HD-GYP domain-containing protein, partial [Terriglobales bacterium]
MSFAQSEVEPGGSLSTSESTGAKLARVVPLIGEATADGIGASIQDAWSHKGRTAGEFGLSAAIGATIASVQTEAALPRVALELGVLALGVSCAKQMFTQGAKAFSAIGDAWRSPDHIDQDRAAIAGSLGPLVFDTALTTGGGMLGAGLIRTVPVAWSERGLLKDLNDYHPETAEHSIRTAKYSWLSARERGLSWGEQREAYHAGLMHDTGKLDMPIDILGKTNGQFTPEEWDVVHQHPIDSLQHLQEIPYAGALKNVPADASMHHE